MTDFLSLDISKSRTGWARWKVGDDRPLFGSFKCGSEYTCDGQAQETIFKELRVITTFGMPDYFAVERPADASKWTGGRKFEHSMTLIRLAGAAVFFAYNNGIPAARIAEIEKNRWFPAFIGPDQRAPKGESKSYCVERCKSLGLKPQNDDEADALGILDYMISLHGIIPPWRAENLLVPQLARAG